MHHALPLVVCLSCRAPSCLARYALPTNSHLLALSARSWPRPNRALSCSVPPLRLSLIVCLGACVPLLVSPPQIMRDWRSAQASNLSGSLTLEAGAPDQPLWQLLFAGRRTPSRRRTSWRLAACGSSAGGSSSATGFILSSEPPCTQPLTSRSSLSPRAPRSRHWRRRLRCYARRSSSTGSVTLASKLCVLPCAPLRARR